MQLLYTQATHMEVCGCLGQREKTREHSRGGLFKNKMSSEAPKVYVALTQTTIYMCSESLRRSTQPSLSCSKESITCCDPALTNPKPHSLSVNQHARSHHISSTHYSTHRRHKHIKSRPFNLTQTLSPTSSRHPP